MARKKSDKKRPVATVPEAPSSRLGTMATAAIVVLGLAIAGIILAGSNDRDRRSEPRDRPTRSAPARTDAAAATINVPFDPKAAIERQLEDQGWYERVLMPAVAGDDRGEELAVFFHEHAIFSRLVGQGATVQYASGTTIEEVRSAAEDPLTFEVTPASTEDRRRNGLVMQQAWQWDAARNELFVPPPGTFTDLWAGIIFAHELSHAHDTMTGTEPHGLPGNDPRFLDGEIRAYALEFRLLRLRTDGRWRATAETVLDRMAVMAGATDWLRLGSPDRDVFDALYPPHLSIEEQATRRGAATVFVNFLLNERRSGGIDGQRIFMLSLSAL